MKTVNNYPYEYIGKCSCGVIEVRLASNLAPDKFQPRSDSQTCGFCREHDGVWISDPNGIISLRATAHTTIKRFASRQVQFHFCSKCKELVYALFEDPYQKKSVAVARVALFDEISIQAFPTIVTNFEGETLIAGQQRRLAKWTPVWRIKKQISTERTESA